MKQVYRCSLKAGNFNRQDVSLITVDRPKEMVYPRISSSGDVSARSLNSSVIRGSR